MGGVRARAWILPLLCAAALLPARAEQVCNTQDFALSSPTSRFVDNGDGTITDTRSRLMWMRCAVGQQWSAGRCLGEASVHDWSQATSIAAAVNRQGHYFFDDWRLPDIAELATIAERECSNPRINLRIFPDTPAAWFWSTTSRVIAGGVEAAFALSFGPEGVEAESKGRQIHVRLVRNAD